MKRAPNQRDLAKAAGVCPATVSLALRNHPSIPESTRKRIREVAEELGYRPNSRVAELMGHIRRNRAVDDLRETVAMVWADLKESEVGKRPQLTAFEQAIRQTLQQHGMGLLILYRQPNLSTQRMERILHSRGIRGVILAPLTREVEVGLDWNWSGFSVVIAGSATFRPDFNRVRFNHFADMRLLVHQLQKLGKRRMGLLLAKTLEERSQHAIDGGFWTAVPAGLRKEDAVFDLPRGGRKAFLNWLKTYRPDSLIVSSPNVVNVMRDLNSPPPIFMRTLESIRGPNHPPGIRQDYGQLGRVAAEQLFSQLQLNQTGIPDSPLQVLITGEWEEPEGTAKA